MTSAKKKKSDEVSDPVYRLLRYAQREDDEQMKRFATVPEGFDIALVNEREVSADARLKQLNKLLMMRFYHHYKKMVEVEVQSTNTFLFLLKCLKERKIEEQLITFLILQLNK